MSSQDRMSREIFILLSITQLSLPHMIVARVHELYAVSIARVNLIPRRAKCLQVFALPLYLIDELRSLISKELPSPGYLGLNWNEKPVLGPPWNEIDNPDVYHITVQQYISPLHSTAMSLYANSWRGTRTRGRQGCQLWASAQHPSEHSHIEIQSGNIRLVQTS
jgi:hypothetical protein